MTRREPRRPADGRRTRRCSARMKDDVRAKAALIAVADMKLEGDRESVPAK